MAYFDLHLHPAFKTFLSSSREAGRPSCWTSIKVDILLDELLGDIFDSQSSLSQLHQGQASVVVGALYAMERPFAGLAVLQRVAGLVPEVDEHFLRAIAKGAYSYSDLIRQELTHLHLSKQAADGRIIAIIERAADIQPGQLNVILALEGGHCLFDADDQGALANLQALKMNGPRMLYLTLAHLVDNGLCTHAYGMKLVKDDVFYPKRQGLTAAGKDIIREAIQDSPTSRRILIDVKHMSLQSRLQYYQLRQEEFPAVPILASHVAATGVSYTDAPVRKARRKGKHIRVRYDRPPGLHGTSFNPWSINLYDEEIALIVQSGGLIGVSLDQRILGFGNPGVEVFSTEEYKLLRPDEEPTPVGDMDEDEPAPEFEADRQLARMAETDFAEPQLLHPHIRYLCNQILHMVQVGGPNTWNCLCIGSDFDGIINAVNVCKSAAAYPQLERLLITGLTSMAGKQAATYHLVNVGKQVRDLMHGNARRFLDLHFS